MALSTAGTEPCPAVPEATKVTQQMPFSAVWSR